MKWSFTFLLPFTFLQVASQSPCLFIYLFILWWGRNGDGSRHTLLWNFFCFCFFKSLSPFRQLCLAFLAGRGEGACFGDVVRQDNEPSWSLGSGWAWLWVRPSAEPSPCAFSNLREEDLGEKRLMILSLAKMMRCQVTQKLQSQWTWRDSAGPGHCVGSAIRLASYDCA